MWRFKRLLIDKTYGTLPPMNALKTLALAALSVLPLTSCSSLATSYSLVPVMETEASPYRGDSLDDSAVWHHPDNPNQSLILTTLKASNVLPVKPTGIITYDLAGKQIQFFEDGTPNNIDTRHQFQFSDGTDQIIGTSHWYTGEIGLYRVNKETLLLNKVGAFQTGVEKLRGFCFGKANGLLHAFAVGSDGDIEQYAIPSLDETRLVDRWQLDSESEGCVVDDETGMFYVAEENHGIWRVDLTQPDPKPILLDKVRLFGPLKRGLEGLSLVRVDQTTYLVVSVQERSRFAIYNLTTETHMGNFQIGATQEIDPVSQTDGIHIEPLVTGEFATGLVIVHDDQNETPSGEQDGQNFKIVPLDSLVDFIRQLNFNR